MNEYSEIYQGVLKMLLKDQTIIITGGSSGMGFYMAKHFVEEGANVVITGRDLERLETAQKAISHDFSHESDG
jgi:short-subunit dehydrogenase involved in D-alanine esterification of teichoic acids